MSCRTVKDCHQMTFLTATKAPRILIKSLRHRHGWPPTHPAVSSQKGYTRYVRAMEFNPKARPATFRIFRSVVVMQVKIHIGILTATKATSPTTLEYAAKGQLVTIQPFYTFFTSNSLWQSSSQRFNLLHNKCSIIAFVKQSHLFVWILALLNLSLPQISEWSI